MTNLASLRTHHNALKTLLDATGLTVFDAGPPTADDKAWGWQDVPGQSIFDRYVILYELSGGTLDGTLGDPDDDASLIWQVTCVAETREACQWLADKVNATLIGRPLAVAGRFVPRLRADLAGGGTRRDDTVKPPVYIATPRYRADSTPA